MKWVKACDLHKAKIDVPVFHCWHFDVDTLMGGAGRIAALGFSSASVRDPIAKQQITAIDYFGRESSKVGLKDAITVKCITYLRFLIQAETTAAAQ